jgi:hypothetical protein
LVKLGRCLAEPLGQLGLLLTDRAVHPRRVQGQPPGQVLLGLVAGLELLPIILEPLPDRLLLVPRLVDAGAGKSVLECVSGADRLALERSGVCRL